MKKRAVAVLLACMLLLLCACDKKIDGTSGAKEDSAGTKYGSSKISALNIEDFYFLAMGTKRADVVALLGNPHSISGGDFKRCVYNIGKNESILIEYNERDEVIGVSHTNEDAKTVNFLETLVSLGILKSIVSPNPTKPADTSKDNSPQSNDSSKSGIFSTDVYEPELFKAELVEGMLRSTVLEKIGKPNHFSSRNFNEDGYIIDCYVLNTGEIIYIDYGYSRQSLRCARIELGGINSALLGTWSTQEKPLAFTRPFVTLDSIGKLKKNMSPEQVYERIGEPHWFTGERSKFEDAFELIDGAVAYLDFGQEHNKLVAITIVDTAGNTRILTIS